MTEYIRLVSGLAGGDDRTPVTIDPRSAALLMRIRAKADADLLAPRTVRRFDGEWLEPDPQDIEAKEIADAIVRLIDAVTADPSICAPLAARLAPGGRAR